MSNPALPVARAYPLGEEIANAVTHGVGAIAAMAATPVLIVAAVRSHDPWAISAYSIFGASLILLYVMSTLYHSLTNPRAKKVLRVFDHGSIFVLIAGTYTVFTLTVLRGPIGFSLFGIVWGVGIAGIVLFAIFGQRVNKLSLVLYLVLGWAIAFAAKPLKAAMPPAALGYLFWGGAAYTIGAIAYAMKKVPWTHPLWHLFVMAGSGFHVAAALAALPV
jgi:hemolysin III